LYLVLCSWFFVVECWLGWILRPRLFKVIGQAANYSTTKNQEQRTKN
jgi:hypothetical protein